jgi:uncharacterized membrane protein YhaH (DUF805 family)
MKSLRVYVPVILAAIALGTLCLPAVVYAQAQPEFPMNQDDAAAAAGMGCACLVVSLLIGLVSVGVWIAICVWVYRDATRRGAENAVIWLILVIVTGLLGLIIYLIVRPGRPQ